MDGGKMQARQSAESDLDEKGLALLLGELDHRIRNLLMMRSGKRTRQASTITGLS
jgi:two-component sensor histidine kinase